MILFGLQIIILLYESPGGNQVDGLPPAFHHGIQEDIFLIEKMSRTLRRKESLLQRIRSEL